MQGLLLALVSAALFGAATPASKLLLVSLEPFQLAGLLYLGAALAMVPVAALERRRGARAVLDRRNAVRVGGAVLFGGVLGPVLLLFALRLVLAGSISLLLNLELVATAVLGVLWFREPLGRTGWLGVFGIAISGALLAGAGGWPGIVAASLTAAACFCWAVDNHLTALVDGITPAQSTLVKGAVAGAVNFAIGLAAAPPFAAGAATVAAALVLGALSYGVSIVLYVLAAQQIGATRAQSAFATAPFAGAALSIAFLGEPLDAPLVAAFALSSASIAALLRSRHVHDHVHEPVEHVHRHRHDDGHHLHDHPGLPASTLHTHAHRHDRLEHAHPHWPDLHHRHDHAG